MSTPNPLPPRKVPGWLYALLFTATLAAYVALVITGHSSDTSSLLLVAAPILGSVFVADRVSATAKTEGAVTRLALVNGTLTAGLVAALDHPAVLAKLEQIVRRLTDPNAAPVDPTAGAPLPPVAPAVPILTDAGPAVGSPNVRVLTTTDTPPPIVTAQPATP